MEALVRISQQISNSTTPAYAPTEFTVSPSIAAVNGLFFLSLALVLIDAFLAMLVKSWLQEFDRGWKKYTVANLRAQEREQRLRGLERWKLAELVALLPILIQMSLLFFSIGLLVLLFPIHLISAIISSLALVTVLAFYVITTSVSIFDAYAPFSSPVSRGFTILIDTLWATWVTWHISHPLPPQGHEAKINSSRQSSLGNNRNTRPLPPQGDDGIEKRTVVARSRFQVNPQMHVNILERLVMITAEAVENIPVFLDLLDQPVKYPTVRPSNIEKWKQLLHITLGLLGEVDPSFFSDSAAWTIARTMMFCYDGETTDEQLSRRLIHRFGHTGSSQTSRHKPLNSLYAPYMDYSCGFSTIDRGILSHTIASLEPSDDADLELLWMVNTIHRAVLWRQLSDWSLEPDISAAVLYESLDIFAAVLTYVSSTEQSIRSQVPLTAAVIYAMHTIKSALDKGAVHPIQGPYTLPGNDLTASTFASLSMTFHQAGALDLWSEHCVELASALLQPHTHWSGRIGAHLVWRFQLPLVAALYIDSTRHGGHASATFTKLLKLTSIPEITMSTWGWVDAYDKTKLAGYWYMAHFQEPLYQRGIQNSPFQDVGYVIMQTIQHSSEMTLSGLSLLDTSVTHLRGTASPSSIVLTRLVYFNLKLRCTLPSGPIEYRAYPSDPWIVFHLDTLFAQRSNLQSEEVGMLEWADTPEQIYIAMARLSLYDSLQGQEHEGTKELTPDPPLLEMFLRSHDYSVCAGAFKWCLNLVREPSASGDVHRIGVFVPETMGYGWIKHLMQVLCGSVDDMMSSWGLLAAHLVPKWSVLPSPWCNHFASAFLFSNVNLPDMYTLPAYQSLAEALKDPANNWETKQLQAFLSFLATVLERIKHSWTCDQLTSLDNWLTQLPEVPGKNDAHAQVEAIRTTEKQRALEDTLRFFSELPLADLATDE